MLSTRSIEELKGVDSDLIRVVVLAERMSPVKFVVSEGMRCKKRQIELVAKGSSKTMNSKHLVGRAVDVMAVGDLNGDGIVDAQDRSITWNREWYTDISIAAKIAANRLGVKIRWGGDFKSFFDGPHLELV